MFVGGVRGLLCVTRPPLSGCADDLSPPAAQRGPRPHPAVSTVSHQLRPSHTPPPPLPPRASSPVESLLRSQSPEISRVPPRSSGPSLLLLLLLPLLPASGCHGDVAVQWQPERPAILPGPGQRRRGGEEERRRGGEERRDGFWMSRLAEGH